MKFTLIAIAMAAVQGVALKFDHETEVALSQQQKKNKWFEDDIHDDEYSQDDVENMVRDKTHVQLADNMQYKLQELVYGFEPEFEDLDVQLGESMATNNQKMARIAIQYGTY